MFCGNCGSVLEEDAVFCPQCGFRVPQVTEPVPEKGKKKGVWIAIAAALTVVLVSGIMVCLNMAAIGNFFRKTFSSPDEYYRYVEMQAAEEMTGHMANIYSNLLERSSYTDRSLSLDITAEMSKDGQRMAESLLGYDLEWLQNVSAGLDFNSKDKLLQLSFETALGGQNIVSGDFMADLEKGQYFLKIPELSDKYISIDYEELTGYNTAGMWGFFEQDYAAAAPDKELAEKLLTSYMITALECIKNVEMESDELYAGDLARTCTKLTVTLDEDTLQDVVKAVCKRAVEDEELKKLIISMAEAQIAYVKRQFQSIYENYYAEMGVYDDFDDFWDERMGDVKAEYLYDEFQESLEAALDEIDELSMDGKLKMNIWVDNKGNIVGRELGISTDYDKITVFYKMVKEGRRFAYEAGYDDDYGKAELTGEGTASGDTLTGEFVLAADGKELLIISTKGLDTESLKDGFLNGSLTFSMGDDALSAFKDEYGLSLRTEYALRLDSSMKKDEENMVLTLLKDEAELVSFDITAKAGKGSKVTVPSGKQVKEIADEEALADWMLNADWDSLLKNLDKAGLDSELYDYLEEGLNDMLDEIGWY